jgi:hypothetical protein
VGVRVRGKSKLRAGVEYLYVAEFVPESSIDMEKRTATTSLPELTATNGSAFTEPKPKQSPQILLLPKALEILAKYRNFPKSVQGSLFPIIFQSKDECIPERTGRPL